MYDRRTFRWKIGWPLSRRRSWPVAVVHGRWGWDGGGGASEKPMSRVRPDRLTTTNGDRTRNNMFFAGITSHVGRVRNTARLGRVPRSFTTNRYSTGRRSLRLVWPPPPTTMSRRCKRGMYRGRTVGKSCDGVVVVVVVVVVSRCRRECASHVLPSSVCLRRSTPPFARRRPGDRFNLSPTHSKFFLNFSCTPYTQLDVNHESPTLSIWKLLVFHVTRLFVF